MGRNMFEQPFTVIVQSIAWGAIGGSTLYETVLSPAIQHRFELLLQFWKSRVALRVATNR